MKYFITAALKSLKEITGSDHCEGITVDMCNYRYDYNSYRDKGGVVLSFIKGDYGLAYIDGNLSLPLFWLKDIKPIKEPMGKDILGKAIFCGNSKDWNIEELYQAFKKRLMEELEVHENLDIFLK